MTALPPTSGHLQLVQFASQLKDVDHVTVLLCTQPHEPFVNERLWALYEAAYKIGGFYIYHYDKEIEQNPLADGFWENWDHILSDYQVDSNTIIVSSEWYGKVLADRMNAKWMPYDIDRQINDAKATLIRNDPAKYFGKMIPEFRKHLRTTITIFGAESTGKTTLSRNLSERFNAPWLFEYARPYLENVSNEITVESMTDIWSGQKALQKQRDNLGAYSLIIQDTDLYSTIGYWELPHWEDKLGECPDELKKDADELRSDLYLITPSNIPFEEDPVRYGGDHREGSDAYWIGLCEKHKLSYLVLNSSSDLGRTLEAITLIEQKRDSKLTQLAYDRRGL